MGNGLKDHYDQTRKHVQRVQHFMLRFADALARRALVHDESKYSDQEAPLFAVVLPRLNASVYGSEEYKATLREIRPAIDHHNANNSHHPEYYENGVDGMDLLDLVEMLCDWRAATERHATGSITKSIDHNQERFNLSDQLAAIMHNTVPWLEQVR